MLGVSRKRVTRMVVDIGYLTCREPFYPSISRIGILLRQDSQLLESALYMKNSGDVAWHSAYPQPLQNSNVSPLVYEVLDTTFHGWNIANTDQDLSRAFLGRFTWEGLGADMVQSEIQNIRGCHERSDRSGHLRPIPINALSSDAMSQVTVGLLMSYPSDTPAPELSFRDSDGLDGRWSLQLPQLEVNPKGIVGEFPENEDAGEIAAYSYLISNRHTVAARAIRLKGNVSGDWTDDFYEMTEATRGYRVPITK